MRSGSSRLITVVMTRQGARAKAAVERHGYETGIQYGLHCLDRLVALSGVKLITVIN